MMRAAIHLVLAGTVADPALRESIEDDLLEEYRERAEGAGRPAAVRWALTQLFISFPDFAGLGATGSAPCRPFLGASAFYGVLVLVVALGAGVSEFAIRGATLSGYRTTTVGTLLVSVAASGLAGYLVALVASRAPLAAALGFGTVCFAIGAGALALGELAVDGWYLGAWGILAPITALGGGLARVRQRLAAPAR